MDIKWLRCALLLLALICRAYSQETTVITSTLQTNDESTAAVTDQSSPLPVGSTIVPDETPSSTDAPLVASETPAPTSSAPPRDGQASGSSTDSALNDEPTAAVTDESSTLPMPSSTEASPVASETPTPTSSAAPQDGEASGSSTDTPQQSDEPTTVVLVQPSTNPDELTTVADEKTGTTTDASSVSSEKVASTSTVSSSGDQSDGLPTTIASGLSTPPAVPTTVPDQRPGTTNSSSLPKEILTPASPVSSQDDQASESGITETGTVSTVVPDGSTTASPVGDRDAAAAATTLTASPDDAKLMDSSTSTLLDNPSPTTIVPSGSPIVTEHTAGKEESTTVSQSDVTTEALHTPGTTSMVSDTTASGTPSQDAPAQDSQATTTQQSSSEETSPHVRHKDTAATSEGTGSTSTPADELTTAAPSETATTASPEAATTASPEPVTTLASVATSTEPGSVVASETTTTTGVMTAGVVVGGVPGSGYTIASVLTTSHEDASVDTTTAAASTSTSTEANVDHSSIFADGSTVAEDRTVTPDNEVSAQQDTQATVSAMTEVSKEALTTPSGTVNEDTTTGLPNERGHVDVTPTPTAGGTTTIGVTGSATGDFRDTTASLMAGDSPDPDNHGQTTSSDTTTSPAATDANTASYSGTTLPSTLTESATVTSTDSHTTTAGPAEATTTVASTGSPSTYDATTLSADHGTSVAATNPTTEYSHDVTTPEFSENTIASDVLKTTRKDVPTTTVATTTVPVTTVDTASSSHVDDATSSPVPVTAEGSATTLASLTTDVTSNVETMTNSTVAATEPILQYSSAQTPSIAPTDSSSANDLDVNTEAGATSPPEGTVTMETFMSTEAQNVTSITDGVQHSTFVAFAKGTGRTDSTVPEVTTTEEASTSPTGYPSLVGDGGFEATTYVAVPTDVASGDTTSANEVSGSTTRQVEQTETPVFVSSVETTSPTAGTSPMGLPSVTSTLEQITTSSAPTEAVADENDTTVNLIVVSRNPKQLTGAHATTMVSAYTTSPLSVTTDTPAVPTTATEAPVTSESSATTVGGRPRSWFTDFSSKYTEETTASSDEGAAPTTVDNEVPDLISTLFPELYGVSSAVATILQTSDEGETTTAAQIHSTEPQSTTPETFTTDPLTSSKELCNSREGNLSVSCLLPEELNQTVTVEFSQWNATQTEPFRDEVTQRLKEYSERAGIPLGDPAVVFITSDHGMDMVSFFVVNGTRGSVVSSQSLLTFFNETRPTLEDAVKLSITNVFSGLPVVRGADEVVATAGTSGTLDIIYIVVAACCAALVILIICILTLVKCRGSSHQYSPDAEKLSKDMALKAEIGDLRPGVDILKEEAQMKDTAAVINGNGTHLTKENDGWVVPYAQVPMELKNAPDNQDTKL